VNEKRKKKSNIFMNSDVFLTSTFKKNSPVLAPTCFFFARSFLNNLINTSL
jgi:hypothetical protein